MDRLPGRKAESEQSLFGKKTRSLLALTGNAAFSCLQPVGETCQYPVLFFTECFIYLPQRRRFAVVITPGVQLDTNVNQLEGKQLAPKVLSLFSTQ